MKLTVLTFILLFPLYVLGQTNQAPHTAHFQPGDGLTWVFNEGKYSFSMGGAIQPYLGYFKPDSRAADLFLNSRRSFFTLKGSALQEKIGFCIRTDFSQTQPLLDVFFSYQPAEWLTLSVGQKQNIANNRELLLLDDQLTFPERSLLSTAFARSGREFGVFVDTRIRLGDRFEFMPSLSVTSGDGRNSFGTDSRDVDLGGLKYAARIDVLPLGAFSPGNETMVADLTGEPSPRLLLGFAAGLNNGASEAVGEGHGQLVFYHENGEARYPDYRKLSADVLLKWKGISLLGEFVINTAASLEGSYIDEFGNNPLVPTQISEYLALGRSYHIQAGYCYRGSLGVDLSYSFTEPEFRFNPGSIIDEVQLYRMGLSRYFMGQNLKLQVAGSMIQSEDTNAEYRGEMMVQLRI
jgi:hypothetical protein